MPFVCGYMGNLTKDPVIRDVGEGKSSASFTLASTEGWGKSKRTDFIPCIAWGKNANTVENHLKKGDHVILQGHWQNHPWQKNEKGYDIPSWQYNIEKIVFMPRNKVHEDDDFLPFGGDSKSISSNSSEDLNVDYDGNDFAPLSDENSDLPF